ncbi:MAG: hypothetical protein ACTSSR_07125 [Alphaproteobacteria bacterium]
MIREDGPGFKGPAEVADDRQQAAMQDGQPITAAEMVQLQIGSGSHKVGAALGELVRRGVRPRGLAGCSAIGGA